MENGKVVDGSEASLRVEHLSFTPIVHTWVPVLSSTDTLYHFPEPITAFMRAALRMPAIYRWRITHPDGAIEYYIGETEELCPRRIYHYLKPGPSQMTNLRLNELFSTLIRQGGTVTMEFLHFEPFSVGDHLIDQDSLADGHIRRFLEELFVVVLEAQGGTLLNR